MDDQLRPSMHQMFQVHTILNQTSHDWEHDYDPVHICSPGYDLHRQHNCNHIHRG